MGAMPAVAAGLLFPPSGGAPDAVCSPTRPVPALRRNWTPVNMLHAAVVGGWACIARTHWYMRGKLQAMPGQQPASPAGLPHALLVHLAATAAAAMGLWPQASDWTAARAMLVAEHALLWVELAGAAQACGVEWGCKQPLDAIRSAAQATVAGLGPLPPSTTLRRALEQVLCVKWRPSRGGRGGGTWLGLDLPPHVERRVLLPARSAAKTCARLKPSCRTPVDVKRALQVGVGTDTPPPLPPPYTHAPVRLCAPLAVDAATWDGRRMVHVCGRPSRPPPLPHTTQSIRMAATEAGSTSMVADLLANDLVAEMLAGLELDGGVDGEEGGAAHSSMNDVE